MLDKLSKLLHRYRRFIRDPNTAPSFPPAARTGNHQIAGGAVRDNITPDKYHRLLEDYNIRGKLLEVSNQILASGYGTSTLEEAFTSVIKICMDAIGGDTSVIELHDAQRNMLVGVATDYGPYKPEGYFQLPVSEQALSTLAFHAGHTVAIHDVVNDPRVSQRIRQIFDARSGIAAPLLVDGKVIGVLLTMSKHKQLNFDKRDEQLMEGLARLAALAVHTQRLQKQRIQTEYRFQRLIENAPAAIFLLDGELRIVEANRTAEHLLQMHGDRLININFHDCTADGNDRPHWQERIAASLDGQDLYFETRLRRSDSSTVAVELNITTLTIAGRTVYQVFARDITLRKQAERDLREEKERAEITLNSIGDAVITTDHEGICTGMNPVAEKLFSHEPTSIIGRPADAVLSIVDEHDHQAVTNIVSGCLQGQKYISTGDQVLRTADEREIPVEISAAPILHAHGEISGAVIVIRDVGSAREFIREMSYLASHDTLTGLVNRSEFEKRVAAAIETARENNITHVLCYIDLDRFKVVNDTCGHVAGDELLRQLTTMLHEKFRTSDTFARLGGDEFGLLLENCPLHKGQSVAEEVRQAVQEFRFAWQNKAFDIGASIGVTDITGDIPLEKLLSTVDAACYAAKDEGRNRVQIFSSSSLPQSKNRQRTNWLLEIQDTLHENRFELWRQEIRPLHLHLDHPRYEVLLRMRNRAGEIISPDAFIPTAERFHLMPDLDKWVIDNTLRLVSTRDDIGAGDDHYSLNLSGQSLTDKSILSFIIEASERHSIPPERICFEITETAAITDLSHASQLMATLHGLGFRFALDDFGSGLSSFAYLKYLKVDYLKIDGKFVREIDRDRVDYSMVEAINKIGHAMGIKTIAEFAQNEEIVKRLRDIGVDYIQGWGVGRPQPFLTAPTDDSKGT